MLKQEIIDKLGDILIDYLTDCENEEQLRDFMLLVHESVDTFACCYADDNIMEYVPYV